MKIYAEFSAEGDALGFYSSVSHGERTRPVYGEPDPETGERPIVGEEPNPDCLAPAGAVEITEAQWRDLLDNPGARRWQGGEVVPYERPVPPPPVLTRIAKADVWRRLTEPEAVTLDAALQTAPLRLRRIFEAAQYLDTTDEDYPALRAGIVGALGEARADEVLAPTY